MKLSLFEYYVEVFRYLIKSDYNYSVFEALERIVNFSEEINRLYECEENPKDCAILIGYCCG